jgi:DNA polymerase I-like protein with 3'-5' exonuclease and polymerase domains
LRCRRRILPVLSVHDELVFELPNLTADENLARIVAIMETPLTWACHLPLKVEGKLTPFYAK